MDSSSETVSLDEQFESFTDEYQADVDYTFEESDKEELTLIQRLKSLAPCAKSSIAFCPKCCVQFHNTQRTPLLLPGCGHTVCYPCIQNLRKIEMALMCPVCQEEVTATIQNLPINLALLELLDKDYRQCEKHDLEFAGYCSVHSQLLCGACILEHKKCDICLLSESELIEVVQSVRKEEESKLNDLKQWRVSWIEGKSEFLQIKAKVDFQIEKHVEGLKQKMKKTIDGLEHRVNYCEDELSQCLGKLRTVKENMKDMIMENTEEILNLQRELLRFDDLELVQKLAVKEFEERNRNVSLEQVLKVHEQLEQVFRNFSYEELIRNRALDFMYNM